jgi:hypothetical protein
VMQERENRKAVVDPPDDRIWEMRTAHNRLLNRS